MARITGLLMAGLLLCFMAGAANAQEMTAIDVFDAMIHYENDQLSASNGVSDYHCKITDTRVLTGVTTSKIVIEDLYFMVPTFQLQLIDNEPASYFDDNLLLILLESHELQRERDIEIDGVACYTIRLTPDDPAFARNYKIYYVAKDDFRHVRAVIRHDSHQYDNLTTEWNYVYAQTNGFNLLSETSTVTKDENNNVISTGTMVYSDYEFGIGLDIEFFTNYLEGFTPSTPLN